MDYRCGICGISSPLRRLKRINSKKICPTCYKDYLEKKRKRIKERFGITKKQEEEEKLLERKIRNKEYREEHREEISKYHRDRNKKTREEIPKIKGSDRKKKEKYSQLGLYLTIDEKRLLFTKYLKQGLTPEQADDMVKEDVNFLRELTLRLKKEEDSPRELNSRFKEEFAKLLESERE